MSFPSKFKAILAVSAVIALSLPGLASAQSPAMHEGSFTIGAPEHCGGHSWCSTVGRGAMTSEQINVTNSGNPLFGHKGSVTVMVLCEPQGNQSLAVVVAASMDSPAAESIRNAVRTRMTKAGCL
jgi:hypothetical protein